MAVRAFVEPIVGQASRLSPAGGTPAPLCSKSLVQFFTPSYSLYPVLADIHGAAGNAVPLSEDFAIPRLADLKRARQWDFRAALSFVTTPNAPSGRGYRTAQLEELCRAQKGVVLLDEAYVDFARRKRPEPRAEIPACAGRADLFQGLFALLPARRLLRRPPGSHRRASQNPRQLQRQRPGPDRRAGHAWATCPTTGPTSGEIIATRERLSRELDALGLPGLSEPDQFHPRAPAGILRRSLAAETARPQNPGAVVQRSRSSATTCASPSAPRRKQGRWSKPLRQFFRFGAVLVLSAAVEIPVGLPNASRA